MCSRLQSPLRSLRTARAASAWHRAHVSPLSHARKLRIRKLRISASRFLGSSLLEAVRQADRPLGFSLYSKGCPVHQVRLGKSEGPNQACSYLQGYVYIYIYIYVFVHDTYIYIYIYIYIHMYREIHIYIYNYVICPKTERETPESSLPGILRRADSHCAGWLRRAGLE